MNVENDAFEKARQHLLRLRDAALASDGLLVHRLRDDPEAGRWTKAQWGQLLGAVFHYPVADEDTLSGWAAQDDALRFDVLPLADALRAQALILRVADEWIGLVADPLASANLQARIEARVASPVRWYLAHPDDIALLLSQAQASTRALEQVAGDSAQQVAKDPAAHDISLSSIGQDTRVAVQLINSTLYDALGAEASDIHLETHAAGLAIKFRIDGVLIAAGESAGTALADQAISRVKVMAGLDIAERRVPQDGRFQARVRGRDLDFRVSIMPSVFGEDAVIRILDRERLAGSLHDLSLDTLGFHPSVLATIRKLVNEPYGMFLVTGPTGSGKTTTLYAAISEVNNGQEKIITIEDPVEYQLKGVLQIPVHEKKGLTFARGLRSILRHDPDKIMVGEIRDAETAEIAIQSALTGHLVLTTVHANSVFDVVGRFMHMGIDPYGLVSALNGILAQRLVRLICPDCLTPAQVDEDTLHRSGLYREAVVGWQFKSGQGCEHCRGTGYRGRHAIAECLLLDDTLREMIVSRAPAKALKAYAYQHGTRTLRAVGLELVRMGKTTLAELNRVTSLHEITAETLRSPEGK